MNKKNFLLLIVIMFFLGCNKDEGIESMIPSVSTSSPLVGNNGGVTFSGSVNINSSTIVDHGFQYYNKKKFIVPLVVKYPLGPLDQSKNFEYFLKDNLTDGFKYYVRAYASTDSGTSYYGKVESFISNGMVTPIIKSVSSNIGHIGDTIQILGVNFKTSWYKPTVNFNYVESRILSANDTIITCIIPENIELINSEIEVKLDIRNSNLVPFTLYKPEISSFSPAQATFRDTITLFGNHFDADLIRTEVFLGNVKVELIEADREFLKVIVPDNLESSSELIRVKSQIQSVSATNEFKLTPPEITFIEPEFITDSQVEIQGKYFHPNPKQHKVFFDEIRLTIIAGGINNLKVKSPWAPYSGGKGRIKVQLLDLTVEYEIDLTLLDRWAMNSDNFIFK